jgi:hypothetical protein
MSEKPSDPQELAKSVALEVASEAEEVGDFVTAVDEDDNITDFRFVSHVRGYENWQWSVTLFHDEELDTWTVDESSLIPAQGALLPPKWIPWKERLLPEDLSVTDAMGTEEDDPRIEAGMSEDVFNRAAALAQEPDDTVGTDDADVTRTNDLNGDEVKDTDESTHGKLSAQDEEFARNAEDLADAAIAFHLTRKHVMSAEGRAETAKRWYAGQHGPKSLSTKTADGLTCEECGFLIPLQGELGRLFAVCANKWSPDDGKVVSLDHGCGEHSQIEAAEGSQLWVQSEPAYDDLHIDVERHAEIIGLGSDKLASQTSEPASDAELPEIEILESQGASVDMPQADAQEDLREDSNSVKVPKRSRSARASRSESAKKTTKTTKSTKTHRHKAVGSASSIPANHETHQPHLDHTVESAD